MNFGRPSRKDDLINLIYLLLSLNNDFEIVKLDTDHLTLLEYFKHVITLKREMTIDDYCNSSDAKLLRPFITEVWGLSYEEEPNYDKLKFLLSKILLDQD